MADRLRLPAWNWAFAVFRFTDGSVHALIPLAALTVFGLPVWAVALTTAVMNLGAVPAHQFWCGIMAHGRGRRRIATMGFTVGALGLVIMASDVPFAVFLAAALVYTVFGVATAPAASLLLLEAVPRSQWGAATGRLSRRTGLAFLAGVVLSVALGLAGRLDLRVMFGVAAVLALAAGVAAWNTIAPFTGPAPARRYRRDVVRASQRRFERFVFFPARLVHTPSVAAAWQAARGPMGRYIIGIALMFVGSALVLASYPGVLRERLGYAIGIVLLAQAPSNFMSPLTFPFAGRYGDARGDRQGVRVGSAARAVIVPAMCIAVLADVAWTLPALLVLHAALGGSFAFLQVNGACLLADLHPRGRSAGVGSYHAAVGVGALAGSGASFVATAVAELWVSYVAASALTVLGAVAVWSARPSQPVPADAPAPAAGPLSGSGLPEAASTM